MLYDVKKTSLLFLLPIYVEWVTHPYQLDEFISNLRVVCGIYHFYSNFYRTFCRPRSVATLCGVWSGSVLLVYVPQKERKAYMGL